MEKRKEDPKRFRTSWDSSSFRTRCKKPTVTSSIVEDRWTLICTTFWGPAADSLHRDMYKHQKKKGGGGDLVENYRQLTMSIRTLSQVRHQVLTFQWGQRLPGEMRR